MAWTVAQITSLFRDLTGRKSANQISDEDILTKINHYFQYVFPGVAQISEFRGWYTFDTVDGTGSQSIPDTVTEVFSPAYVDDGEVSLWTDEKRFYEKYPHDYATEKVPMDILLFDRSLILRPIPDNTYEVRLRKRSSTPDALTLGEIDNPLWGPALGYGTSIMYLLDKAEKDSADEHIPTYKYYISTVRDQFIRQQYIGKRPVGGRF